MLSGLFDDLCAALKEHFKKESPPSILCKDQVCLDLPFGSAVVWPLATLKINFSRFRNNLYDRKCFQSVAAAEKACHCHCHNPPSPWSAFPRPSTRHWTTFRYSLMKVSYCSRIWCCCCLLLLDVVARHYPDTQIVARSTSSTTSSPATPPGSLTGLQSGHRTTHTNRHTHSPTHTKQGRR